ncbi:MAG: type IX secretion system membrane protein PorP/SprF [Flavobacteriales bacterium]|nr:type IX secretion system membrane protein PorP/SprF [Flavobacteriales bacterium]
MKKLKNIFFVAVCMSAITSTAQQDPMFTHYMFNTLAVNPAYAGSADLLSITALHRSQWMNFEGAPTTQTLTLHTPLKKESFSFGGSIINDTHGPVKQTGIYLDGSYRIFFDNARLAFGLKGGVNLFSADLIELNPLEDGDLAFSQNIESKPLPNFGFGMMYYTRKFYIGLSGPKLLQNGLIDGELPEYTDNEERQHMFLITGALFELSNYVKFKPSLLLKAVNGAPPGLDLSAQFLFYDKLWIGGMYRWEDAVGALVQYEINNKFKFGYSYDYTLSDIGMYSDGSHEIMLGIDIGRKPAGDVSPRFMNRWF